jgi:hypothetical protein
MSMHAKDGIVAASCMCWSTEALWEVIGDTTVRLISSSLLEGLDITFPTLESVVCE